MKKKTDKSKIFKIKNVRAFSNAYNLRIKEDDIILGIDGEYLIHLMRTSKSA